MGVLAATHCSFETSQLRCSNIAGQKLAMLASSRTGWCICCVSLAAWMDNQSFRSVCTDTGQVIDLCRDSPAMVQRIANRSVWRWRWRRVEQGLPTLVQGNGGYGAFMSPVYRLLNGKDTANWGHAEKGALRSLITNRQWPQARLFQAKLADSPNCKLCIRAGPCDPFVLSPRFKGNLLHRILSCPATAQFRRANAPQWILDLAARCTNADGVVELEPDDHLLMTRALLNRLNQF